MPCGTIHRLNSYTQNHEEANPGWVSDWWWLCLWHILAAMFLSVSPRAAAIAPYLRQSLVNNTSLSVQKELRYITSVLILLRLLGLTCWDSCQTCCSLPIHHVPIMPRLISRQSWPWLIPLWCCMSSPTGLNQAPSFGQTLLSLTNTIFFPKWHHRIPSTFWPAAVIRLVKGAYSLL